MASFSRRLSMSAPLDAAVAAPVTTTWILCALMAQWSCSRVERIPMLDGSFSGVVSDIGGCGKRKHLRLELHLSCSLEYHSATKSPWLPSKCGDRCAERIQTSWRLLASFARPGYMALPYCHISVKCADAAEGLCACVDANLMVRFGRVSIMYTTEYVCRSFEENTVRISLAHQTPFQRQVFPTRCSRPRAQRKPQRERVVEKR